MSSANQIAQLCSGGIGAGAALFNYWNEQNCPAAYSQIMNTSPDGTITYNPQGQQQVQTYVTQLFNTYFETNTLTDDVTSTNYNPFQNTLLDLCINPTLPGACTNFLNSYCSNYSRDQATNSPTLTNFCGCYVPPDPTYLSYTLGVCGPTGCTAGCGNQPIGAGCTGQPACDPLCHRALTSQKARSDNGLIITCPQTICVIDDVTITATSSRIPGGINFNSVCSGCDGANGSDGCLCIVSGVNVTSTLSQIGVGTNFNQLCGPSSVCIVEDSSGNIISESGCTGINPSTLPVNTPATKPNWGIVFIIVFLVLLVLLLSIFARISHPKVLPPTILIEK